MDSHSILDHDSGEVPVPGESPKPGLKQSPQQPQADMRFPGEDGGKSLAEMAERDLTATLQLLAERAQYITGASGAAIALRDHEEMVCRASAGSSAPEVGAQLQVNSGLSGESVRTRQTLRCDDATTDERVNRESCEALGIRSVVVMPLLRGEDVIGVFELFSDQANIFETRDLAALERMGAMVHTALEHSAAALGLAPPPAGEVSRPVLPVNEHDSDASSHGFALADDQPPSHSHPAATENAFSAIPASDNGHETAGPIHRPPVPAAPPSASPGIVFHMKMPTRPADSPPPDQAPAPSSLTQEDVVEAKSEEVDILETPTDLSATGAVRARTTRPHPLGRCRAA
jgi:putative methionine-R-sulfoxide reductase with GAF domain